MKFQNSRRFFSQYSRINIHSSTPTLFAAFVYEDVPESGGMRKNQEESETARKDQK